MVINLVFLIKATNVTEDFGTNFDQLNSQSLKSVKMAL